MAAVVEVRLRRARLVARRQLRLVADAVPPPVAAQLRVVAVAAKVADPD